ncbi:alpha/beta hydrolase family esterase [Flagellimonas sp. 2504JD1-5]
MDEKFENDLVWMEQYWQAEKPRTHIQTHGRRNHECKTLINKNNNAMKCRKQFVWSILFLALCTSATNAQLGHEKNTIGDSILVDGIWRIFEFHVPQFPSDNSRLIFVFHDNNMNTKAIQEITGFEFNKQADKTAGSIVVYPQGYKNLWNDCRKVTSIEAKNKGVDNVGFVKSIVQRMERRYHIDRKNVFAVGYFNGGNMCYKLAGETPDIFKGFAVIGATFLANSKNNYTPISKPVSIIMINDVADTINPNNNGTIASLDGITMEKVNPINETLNHGTKLLEHNGRMPKPKVSFIEKSNSHAIRYDYSSSEKNQRVSLLKIVKGGYSFPNPNTKQWPQIGGEMEKQINIPEIVFRFFYQLQYHEPSSLGK